MRAAQHPQRRQRPEVVRGVLLEQLPRGRGVVLTREGDCRLVMLDATGSVSVGEEVIGTEVAGLAARWGSWLEGAPWARRVLRPAVGYAAVIVVALSLGIWTASRIEGPGVPGPQGSGPSVALIPLERAAPPASLSPGSLSLSAGDLEGASTAAELAGRAADILELRILALASGRGRLTPPALREPLAPRAQASALQGSRVPVEETGGPATVSGDAAGSAGAAAGPTPAPSEFGAEPAAAGAAGPVAASSPAAPPSEEIPSPAPSPTIARAPAAAGAVSSAGSTVGRSASSPGSRRPQGGSGGSGAAGAGREEPVPAEVSPAEEPAVSPVVSVAAAVHATAAKADEARGTAGSAVRETGNSGNSAGGSRREADGRHSPSGASTPPSGGLVARELDRELGERFRRALGLAGLLEMVGPLEQEDPPLEGDRPAPVVPASAGR